MIVKTDAVVLKSMRFRETSKIVTFYTRRYGKLAAVAKGARETKSKFGASLEPMTAVSLVLYRKEHRDLQLLSQCDILKPHKRIHSEMERMAVALSILELLHQVTHDEEEHPALYDLLDQVLDALESSSGTLVNFRYAFELRLCALFGFTPVFDRCVVCGTRGRQAEGTSSVMFQLDKGGMLCPACANNVPPGLVERADRKESDFAGKDRPYRKILSETSLILERLFSARMESLGVLEYSAGAGNELGATLRSYLRYHFESVRPSQSARVFDTIAMNTEEGD